MLVANNEGVVFIMGVVSHILCPLDPSVPLVLTIATPRPPALIPQPASIVSVDPVSLEMESLVLVSAQIHTYTQWFTPPQAVKAGPVSLCRMRPLPSSLAH
jgi:hypothetical protein